MKNKLLSLRAMVCVFSLTFSCQSFCIEIKDYEKKIKTGYAIKNIVDKISRKAMEDNLRDFIALSRPGRIVGSPGHEKAAIYLEEKISSFSKAGGAISREEFPLAQEGIKADKGINIVWEKKGTQRPDEVLILGAHYDSLIKDPKTGKILLNGEMPGADNNASGTVALLSLIEILAQLDLPKTVKVVFFDAEELDQAGSRAFLEKLIPALGNQRIVGFVDVKMIGHDSKREDATKKLGNMKFIIRKSTDKGHAQDKALADVLLSNGKRLFPNVDFLLEEHQDSKVRDAASGFWQLDMPAVVITQDRTNDFNPRFHTSNDFFETINLMTYNNVFRFLASAVLAWNYDIVK